MTNDQSRRGGTSTQHAEAGRHSHENREAHQETREKRGEGRGWHGDPERHAAAGRKGGEMVSRDREHMAEIGRRGGAAISKDRGHMAAIGRKGGKARATNRE